VAENAPDVLSAGVPYDAPTHYMFAASRPPPPR